MVFLIHSSLSQDQRFANKTGAIRHMAGDTCSVFIYSERETIPVGMNLLDVVPPIKKDRVSTYFLNCIIEKNPATEVLQEQEENIK